jgi:hypothetical protein
MDNIAARPIDTEPIGVPDGIDQHDLFEFLGDSFDEPNEVQGRFAVEHIRDESMRFHEQHDAATARVRDG